ncbi:MAG TPA: FAD-dependent oxidoreductase [Dehalococcoidia bacterium]|nr:FAD-dependent oxidoreductase [Dehalococcoidia bacterium]
MITEPKRETRVYCETDVLVVGGGPAGVGAAIAAARNGAKTLLIERYGHLGGLATGGLVLCIMPMSDGTKEQQIAGLCQEIIDRLDTVGGAVHPKKEDLGSTNQNLINYWRHYPFTVIQGNIRMSVQTDPEMLKCILNDMIEEAGVVLLLHAYGCRSIVDCGVVKGIVFESKSGRQTIKAKVVVDCTGDGDIFASAGAEYDDEINPELRSSKLALVFRIGNIDVKKYLEFKDFRSERYFELMKELEALGGFTMALRTWRDDVLWFNNFIGDLDGLNIEDLTRVEINARKSMLITYNFFKNNIPGFESCYLMDSASQIGVRSSRRLIGEYILTRNDINSGILFHDTIAVCPAFQQGKSLENLHMHIPYRSLIPREIENLLVAGRCFSSDQVANDILSPIQFCIAMGQAAGTAAALSVENNVVPRKIDYHLLKNRLITQNVFLPL